MAGVLRRFGMAGDGIAAVMRNVNAEIFDPPIPAPELEQTVSSVARYAAGQPPVIAFVGGDELASAAPQHVPWIVEGLLALGTVTELVGPPKLGKSTFVRAIIGSVLSGVPFLGRRVSPGPVVLLSEEHSTSLVRALHRHNIGQPGLRILQRGSVRASSWPDVVAAAVSEARRLDARAVVVDTLPAWSLGDSDENSASDAVLAMRPLSEAAAAGLAVLVVRHQRKSGGDVISAGRGSSAFAGEADIVFTLQQHGARATVRQLDSKSRFEETPGRLVVEWLSTGFVSHGDGQQLAQHALHAAVASALPVTESDAMAIDDLIAALAPATTIGRTKLKAELDTMLRQQLVKRCGAGTKTNRWRYWVEPQVAP
jgi:hypothetical protein